MVDMEPLTFDIRNVLWYVSCKTLGFVFIAIPDFPKPATGWGEIRDVVFDRLDNEARKANVPPHGWGQLRVHEGIFPFVAMLYEDSHPEQTDPRAIIHRIIWFPTLQSSALKDYLDGRFRVSAEWIETVRQSLKPVFDQIYCCRDVASARAHVRHNFVPVQLEHNASNNPIQALIPLGVITETVCPEPTKTPPSKAESKSPFDRVAFEAGKAIKKMKDCLDNGRGKSFDKHG